MNKNLRNAVYGFAVGDALGVPFEFKERGTFTCDGMTGLGTWNQPAGTWSDDTSLVLATCDSIREKGCIDIPDMIKKFAAFAFDGAYTPFGEVFDIGCQTHIGIRYCNKFGVEVAPGQHDIRTNGNGGLMRILPLAFVESLKPEDVINVCNITHPHYISWNAALKYVNELLNLINGKEVNYDFHQDMEEREVKSSGYVVDTLEAVMWCFLKTDNYRDCVIKAVNLGDDTNTIAALAGGLAGLKYGFDGIPKEWIEQLQNKEMIEACLF